MTEIPVELPLALIPFTTAESLGLRRFGSINGLAWFANTAGSFVGPVPIGHTFDVAHSYRLGFELFPVFLPCGAAVTTACRPFESEPTRFVGQQAVA
jgi:hypothetical protein